MKNYVNDVGYEVPKNKILVVPFDIDGTGYHDEIIEPLKEKIKRDWFNAHFYYCLPLNIGNQQGFLIKSVRDFDVYWDGRENVHGDVHIDFLNNDNAEKQHFESGFGQGILTIQNMFALKTSPGINLMTIQPPNMYIPATFAMTGIIETDQIRRDFTFNLKITVPNMKISIRKGDPLGAFIPVQRRFIDNFTINHINDVFDKSFHQNEIEESQQLSRERLGVDIGRPHDSGRRYFNGEYSTGEKYVDHQKRLD